ncbi:Acid protease [Glarea lozoyensis ATCC 20868]|uniref:Acid protease n=1 Tax=Glarea lozoyensis (strain ATCC 20868 / MF5171) TaxID=1116229 RepID=S3DLH9_GLAL2|nr:Acid protease [Glarea lozoyensis ATCC 20868]EPE32901.1 Acid protease [Glarea lozoyensis ATCC 20868]
MIDDAECGPYSASCDTLRIAHLQAPNISVIATEKGGHVSEQLSPRSEAEFFFISESEGRVEEAYVVVSPSQYFEGNDGLWSTFAMRVGNPPQNVRFLPGTTSTSALVVLPEGCLGASTECESTRGGIFKTNQSSTWSDVGIYGLGFENNLGYTDNGRFGYDTISLGYQGSGNPTINHTIVAGIAGSNFWFGQLGLSPQPTNFTDLNNPKPSFMMLLKQQNQIPSLSYSYTAGAKYRLKEVLGSLVLGGYDASRSRSSDLSFRFASDQSRDLTVGLQGLFTNATGANTSLINAGINIFIDSSIAELWLPLDVCTAFEAAFGLTFNSTAGLYLVNDTLHSQLLTQNPTVTFKIGDMATGGATVDIVLPYQSFDLKASFPVVAGNSSRYFPLRRAANDTQYTLGRTFLQEAHLIVDYERKNFSVYPCTWEVNSPERIVTIPPLRATDNSTMSSIDGAPKRHGFSQKKIAGIVIGILAIISILAATTWFFLIHKRRDDPNNDASAHSSIEVVIIDQQATTEVEGEAKYEAEGDARFDPLAEMEPQDTFEAEGNFKFLPGEVMGVLPIYELEGSSVEETYVEYPLDLKEGNWI